MQEEAMLNLKWDSFSSHLTNSLDACYEKQFFVDLSLVCKNGTILKCHKMVLANASSFFRRLLVRNDHPHPMIILHDIEADDLKTIINFMYCGKIQVVKSEVKRILKVAEILEVSGLKDIRSKVLAPEMNDISENPVKSSTTENSLKIADCKNIGKSNMEAEAASSISSFSRRLSAAPKSFWNFSQRKNESGGGIKEHAKFRTNPSKKYENNKNQVGATANKIASNDQQAHNVRSHDSDGFENISKKRPRNDNSISWTKVLSEISKETSTPLKRLCVMDEVEITAIKSIQESSQPTELKNNSEACGVSHENDPLDISGICIKEEIDADSNDDDDYDSNTMAIDGDEDKEQQNSVDCPSAHLFKTVHCSSGVITLNPKPVTLRDILRRNDSSG